MNLFCNFVPIKRAQPSGSKQFEIKFSADRIENFQFRYILNKFNFIEMFYN
jgi:hypothetical protein